ncbi:hypothetical protein NVIRENTERO_00392 [Sodalis praecaptivus]|nr:hypothetical protein NVIRENTERO_00392 [Sodalis praecaptivus]
MWQGPRNRGLLVKDGRYLDAAKLNPFIFNALPFNLTHRKVPYVAMPQSFPCQPALGRIL